MMQHTSAYIKHKILLEDIINKDGNERAFRMVNLRRKEEEELFAVIMACCNSFVTQCFIYYKNIFLCSLISAQIQFLICHINSISFYSYYRSKESIWFDNFSQVTSVSVVDPNEKILYHKQAGKRRETERDEYTLQFDDLLFKIG